MKRCKKVSILFLLCLLTQISNISNDTILESDVYENDDSKYEIQLYDWSAPDPTDE